MEACRTKKAHENPTPHCKLSLLLGLAFVSCSVAAAASGGTVVIGLAADSGCGKTTFVLRLTSVLGARTAATAAAPPWGGNPDSTLVADVEREMVGVEAGEAGHAVGDVGGDDAAAE
uniref:Phosphoribulokinase/uridine kinase domain-containing protein n=1 Tax=Oryza glumipatula TaxID=40148 RepID=A0A0D9Y255_9ORYZ